MGWLGPIFSKVAVVAVGISVVGLLAVLAYAGDEEAPKGPPAVGDPAPAFRLNDQTGHADSFGGPKEGTWTVIAFFPKAATPG